MSSKKNKAHPSNSSGSCGRATPSTGSDLGPLSLLDRDEGAHQLSLVQDNRGGIASRPASAGKAPLPNNDHFEVVRPLGFPPTAEDTPPLSMFDREEQPKAEVANSLSTSWILVEDHSETYEPDARKLSDAEHQWEFSVENGAKGKYLFHLPGEYPFPLKPDIDFDSLSDDIYTQFLHFD
ncbi:uncharacterized protein BDR25DRAFT_113232 [Lindgomyces ingoldianus]|uniref:Uncharacterized protein n=1 Tax=Lindgomyces ingoldianus TaxID=673940 RepID=A0ACB6R848_9PLEO|nr:uncharacterized protein BDR25DRAFT_113232 [Lindgomyces ingoldianus]KAF2474968.1 hypothetical protein BDR25DRAFT_113232 [Lindgomyces ingoldianus]